MIVFSDTIVRSLRLFYMAGTFPFFHTRVSGNYIARKKVA